MNAAEIFVAVQEAGATLRVEGDSLVASHASRIAPAIKAAIRENRPHLIAALLAPPGPGCKVEIIELPRAPRYRKVFGVLQVRPPALVPVERWQRCVKDGSRFLALWGEQAESLGWTSVDLFGLHTPPERPHPSYSRLSRYDCTGLCWLLQGCPVVALTEDTATIRNPATGRIAYCGSYGGTMLAGCRTPVDLGTWP
jgi:hypothetical protein